VSGPGRWPIAALLLVASGCGVRTDNSYRAINKAELPPGLNETTTTTTTLPPTTTTLPPTTVVAPSTTTPTTQAPTTTTTVPTETLNVYYVVGTGQLQAVPVALPKSAAGVQTSDAVRELIATPRTPAFTGATTNLTRSLFGPEPVVTIEKGVATVALDKSFFQSDTLSSEQQILAFGQIVLTLTKGYGFGIGSVKFTVAGQTRSAKRPDQSFTPDGISFPDDYKQLVVTSTT
jgi:spore germination protein GerM